jgi:LuxR family maltose regulon positive regulatory protein
VPRTGLLALLEAAGPVPVVAVVAPAGYGKSTLLAQWADRRQPRSAWISCDDGDNDPAVLLTGLAAALTRLGAVDAGLVAHISRNADVTAVPTLMEAIDPEAEPATVVLDHVEAVVNGSAVRADRVRAAAAAGMAGRDGVPARAAAAGGAAAAAGPAGRAGRDRTSR